MLHGIADEDEFQVITLGDFEELHGVLVAEHARFRRRRRGRRERACMSLSSRKRARVLASKPSFSSTFTAVAVVPR